VNAAVKKDAGERTDLEAGMAKLYASEMCMEVCTEALRIHGGYGYSKEFTVERLFRDAPFFLIGEGTSEIQKRVIGRQLLERYKVEG
jgi:alkylation response protein AidB-like acyl-CoA dehydrogenase